MSSPESGETMLPTIYLTVDRRGWLQDPEVYSSVLLARIRFGALLRVQASELDERSPDLPAGEAVLLLLLGKGLPAVWHEALRKWVAPSRRLYVLYLDDVPADDLRALAALTAAQTPSRPPYRIVQASGVGIERATGWIEEILTNLTDSSPEALPPLKVTPTRWRNLPSNARDPFAQPDQLALSMPGVADYKLTAASHRGKTHAHHGTFREDAAALAVTPHWNLIAVADGAGTAPLARVGSNLAVTAALQAMKDSAPATPGVEDLGRTIWAGMKAAYQAVRDFAGRENVALTDLHTTLQLLIHWPHEQGTLLGLLHIGDGLIIAEGADGQYYMLTEPDTDPEDSGRTLFLTSGTIRQWQERTKVFQFDERLNIVAMMTDGLAGDLEPIAERLQPGLFEPLRQRILCYPLPQREQALLAFLSYDRRGSFDDRTLAVLSRE